MKKSLTRILALAVGIVMLLSLAACGSSGNEPASNTPQDSAKTSDTAQTDKAAAPKEATVEFWLFNDWTTDIAGDEFNTYVADFEKENPGIKVKLVGKPDTEIKSGIITGASSGVMPDAFTMGLNQAYSLTKTGAVQDITAQWNAESPDYKAQFTKSIVDSLSADGKVWGIPLTGWSTILYRNLDVLKKAGIDPSKGITDWNDWLAQMQAVKQIGVDAMTDYTVDGWAVYNFLGGVDGVSIDVKEDKVTVTEDQYATAFKFMKDIAQYASKVPRNDASADDLFISGKVAFVPHGPWPYVNYEKAKTEGKLNYDVVQIPAQSAGKNGGLHGGEWLGITNGKNADAAYKWISFLADQKQMSRFAAKLGRLVYNDEAMKDPEVQKNALLVEQVKALAGGINDAAYFKPLPSDVKEVSDAANAVANGKATPEQAAKDCVANVNKLILDTK